MDNLLDTQQYADNIGVSRRTVQRWIQQGLVFAVKVGRNYYLDPNEPPPNADYESGEANSNVEPITATTDEGRAGLPVERETGNPPPFRPEVPDEEEEEEEEEECHSPDEYERKDLRKAFSTRDEAEAYAGDIPVNTEVFKRCSDGFYQVVVNY